METYKPEEIIELLDLKPLDIEGGFFRETYRSKDTIPKAALPAFYYNVRCFGTAIYYLLTPDNFSTLHKVNSDEIFHFYLGDPVEMLLLYPDGTGREVMLGQDIQNGQLVQLVVPRGVWQGASLQQGGKYALLGTTVSPGFEYQDYIQGQRESLASGYSKYASLISKLTR
ncbi:MAG: cupin domain-containing protein [Candidatus Edwardsbacteria bacterium]|nr:cupin domain-containing protein [Candidatus Edwardsbacteria bacterium]MBU1575783.1 cupin domain-containing protein [Candidatus Edwardsbacteria bacterium]MBU2464000.1 cupin domain-containing protein [Candidatus Edwardsbacteria bacterium]MBU2593244.1 cupin domain-containing protein [Candidatus Edwardsbacteria bacterium]